MIACPRSIIVLSLGVIWFLGDTGVDVRVLGDVLRLEKLMEENRLLFIKVGLLYEFERLKVVDLLTSILGLAPKTAQGLFVHSTWTKVSDEIKKCSIICKKLSGIRFGKCITSTELHLRTKAQLRSALEHMLGSSVEIEFCHSDLIGGIILELGDYRFDMSYLRILDELEKRFLNNVLLEVKHE